jgi:DNA-damage-inducible protein J
MVAAGTAIAAEMLVKLAGAKRFGTFQLSCKCITLGRKGSITMSSSALVQTRIDRAVKERAAEVLGAMGMTVSDAVRILLTRTAREGALPLELVVDEAAYDDWFRKKVQEALDDAGGDLADEEVREHFAGRRAKALASGMKGRA